MSSKSGSEQEVKVDRERQKRIKECIKEAIDTHGTGAVMRLGEAEIPPVDVISTGCLSLDISLGCGGFPRGVMVEVFGPEGGGKTTLCLQVIAESHRIGGEALFIDAENSLNLDYAAHLGVDVKRLLVSQPDYGEQAFQIAQTFIKNKAVDVVVVDSVATLVPKSEFEGEIGDAGVGQQARMVTQALRLLNNDVRKFDVTVVFVNQLRDKIGGASWGPTETTPAGRMLKHLAQVRVDIRRIASLKDGDRIVGARTKAKVVKNKWGTPFVECEYDLIFGEGVSSEGELVDLAAKCGVVEKAGPSYSYKGERMGTGRENAKAWLKKVPNAFLEIRNQVRSIMLKK
jgi:recombination protein RecA